MNVHERSLGTGRNMPGLFINNDWVAPRGGGTEDIVNPATEALYGVAAVGDAGDCDVAISAARHSFDTGP